MNDLRRAELSATAREARRDALSFRQDFDGKEWPNLIRVARYRKNGAMEVPEGEQDWTEWQRDYDLGEYVLLDSALLHSLVRYVRETDVNDHSLVVQLADQLRKAADSE